MRLEDWQKWIDAQFLDDGSAGAEPAVEEPQRVEEEPAAEPPAAVTPAPPPVAQAPAPVAEPEPAPKHVSNGTGHTNGATPAPAAPEKPVEKPRETTAFSSLADSMEMPSIERYLPFLRSPEPAQPVPAAMPEPVAETPAEEEQPTGEAVADEAAEDAAAALAPAETAEDAPAEAETPAQEAVHEPVETAAEEVATEEADAAEELQLSLAQAADDDAGFPSAATPVEAAEEPVPEPVAEAQAPVTEADAPVAAPLFPEPAAPTPAPATAPARELTRTRARHSRGVRAGEAMAELDAASLWNLVPKHIQVLIAMEPREEVAQNSYKRPFKESRIQLVERLLDPTLSLEDTARLLNVCPTTVRRYTNKGILTHQRTQGDQRRFKLSDVLSFLDAQSRS